MAEISVIMPVYNGQNFIGEAIESVLNQSISDFELICIDDFSTDKSKEIILSFKDKRIRYLQCKKNSGRPSVPRNIGINSATGQYITFIDQDDIYKKNSLSDRLSFFYNQPNESFVYSKCLCIEEGEREKFTAPIDSFALLNKYPFIGKCFKELFLTGCFVPIQTVMVKKNVFKRVGLFNEELIGTDDYNMWLRISYFYNLNYIDKGLSIWLIHKKSLSHGQLMMEECTALALEDIVDKYPDCDSIIGKDQMHKRMYQVCFDAAYSALRKGELDTGRARLKKALCWRKDLKTALLFAAAICCGEYLSKYINGKVVS